MAITEDFYYMEGNCSVKNLVKTLVTEITQNSGVYKWNLVVPDSIDKIGVNGAAGTINLITDGSTTDKVQTTFSVSRSNDTCIIKTTTSYGKIFYVKISRPTRELTTAENNAIRKFKSSHIYDDISGATHSRNDAQVLEFMAEQNADGTDNGYNDYVSAMTVGLALNNIRLQMAASLNSDSTDIDVSKDIQERYNYRLAWYRNLQPEIKDFLPVQYWICVTKDSINLVLRGDPSADVAPYNNYLTSYAYIGALKPVEDSAYTDDEYNFGITTSSEIEPNYSNPYGERTGTGVTDVCMIANKIGMPYQPHYPAFYSTNPFMDKCGVEGSRWNHKKHQFSDITLVHPVDMERGKMINVLVGDASSIYDTDKLVYMKGTDSEENYKKFKITAPFNFLNNSSNINYCIAIRCPQSIE
ncbi:hypothetical protein [Clostridium coskatii]|uniref:Uncharacterized protein n=1 Tax=Clostridium coskatii TaxID=1705578 RepID=A0A162LFZ4_9CLOT|nr:hypothetical protein [Clostridium coskatii]OAA92996.1 hypothetical protein WX73_00314 [Clostridium coskatii]OBR90462.1 hypothetical protein CLCOS_40200 [Clostridium coskatii]